MGWGGFLFSLIACGVLIWDRVAGKGKATADIKNELDAICKMIEDMEGRFVVVDGLSKSVAELVFEWRGVDGENGYRSIIKDNRERIRLIEKRNDIIDAVRIAREEDDRRSGGQHRRAMDEQLSRILPEKREERG